MRLWTIHPKYLDPQGLVAVWREALLAQKVLRGETVGYRHHPQLARFRASADPLALIAGFLHAVAEEAVRRDYRFDRAKIGPHHATTRLIETEGQLLYEWAHLHHKLRHRSPGWYRQVRIIEKPEPHPLFTIAPGEVAAWERPVTPRPRR